jgi:lipopolysaccharide export system protein LptA
MTVTPRSSRTRRLRGSFAAALVALASVFLPSLPASGAKGLAMIGGESLDVQAGKLDVDIEKGTATLEGDVSVVMGDLKVQCPKVEMRYDEAPQVRWARGSGGVTASLNGITATASEVVVDTAQRVVRLAGGVRLTRGRGWVEAERASIDLGTHKVTLHDVKGSIPVEPPKH